MRNSLLPSSLPFRPLGLSLGGLLCLAALFISGSVMAETPAGDPAAREGIAVELGGGAPTVELKRANLTATLTADQSQLLPGEEARVALKLDFEDGYYVYWKRPAASTTDFPITTGLATDFKLALPEGYKVTYNAWPVPQKITKPQLKETPEHDLFLYKRGVMFDATISVPADAKAGEDVLITANASWLICNKDSCQRDQVEMVLNLQSNSLENSTPPPASWEQAFVANDLLKPTAIPAGYKVETKVSQTPIRPLDRFAVTLVVTPPARTSIAPPASKDRIIGMFEPAADGSLEHLTRPSARLLDDGRLEVLVPMYADEFLEPTSEPVPFRGVLQIDATKNGVVTPLSFSVESAIALAAAGATVKVETPLDALLAAASKTPDKSSGVSAEKTQALVADLSEASPQESMGEDEGDPIESEEIPLWKALLFAFFGGIILNVMPCVLPVLSLKSLALVELANESKKGVQMHALAYTAGVVSSFWALAAVIVALQSAGEIVDWGFQFREPGFVIFMCALLFAGSLSLLGVFELPGMSVSQSGEQSHGYGTSWMHGVLATLLSTPCSAPLLGGAVGYALTQPPWMVFTIMTLVGLGLALPVILITLFPAAQRLIPRPGMWMNTFKQGVAFLLLGTILWLFSSLSKQLSPSAMVSVLGLLGALSFSSWLYGKFAGPMASGRSKLMTFAAVLLVMGAGINYLSTEAPQSSRGAIVQLEGGVQAEVLSTHGDLTWYKFAGDETMKLAEQGHTVFIDFTADWCATCKTIEATVIESDSVMEKLKENKVITVQADWTRKDKEIEKWVNKYKAHRIPLLVVLPAGKPNQPIIMKDAVTRGQLIEALDRGGVSKPLPSAIKPAPVHSDKDECVRLCANTQYGG